MTTTEQHYMQRAIDLAKKGMGKTSPNPVVGAVLVKHGEVIGEGYHKKAGTAHAEIRAIRNAEKKGHEVSGSSLYITLEPCCHYGRTPPCSDVLVAKEIKHIIIGMIDPFPKIYGEGKRCLKAAGLQVACLSKQSDLYKQISMMNQQYMKWAETGLPYITLKAGMSLDGKIATRTGESRITSDAAFADAHRERSLCDAVLVGAGTVRADNPVLAPTGTLHQKKLLRIIMDPHLSLSTKHKVFRDKYVFVATTNQAAAKDKARFENAGIAFKSFGPKRISIKRLVQFLGKEDVQHIYVEGGSGTHGYFFDDACLDPMLADRVLFYIEPIILGGKDAVPLIGGKGVAKVTDGLKLKDTTVDMKDGTMKVEGFVNKY